MPTNAPKGRHPCFSVVIPTYNHAQYLGKAIRSVLSQTYQDFEIIVVNNYSTDETISVVNAFADKRIRLINYHNQGVIGAARNRGIEASYGKYVAFLDSDDQWYPEKLKSVKEAFEQHSTVDVMGHGICQRNSKGEIVDSLMAGRYREPLYEHLLFEKNICPLSATTVKRDVLWEVGMFSELPQYIGVEDYDLWLKLAHRRHKFYFISSLLGENLVRPDSVSASRVDDQYMNGIAVIKHHYHHDLVSKTLYTKLRLMRRTAPFYYKPGRQHHLQGRYQQALSYYLKAMACYPLYWKAYAASLLIVLNSPFLRDRTRKLL